MSKYNKFIFIDGGCHVFETATVCWDNDGLVKFDNNFKSHNVPWERLHPPPKNPVKFFDENINNHIKNVTFHLFEPNNFKNNNTMNILKQNIDLIEKKFNIDINLHEKALSTHNDKSDFFLSTDKWGDVGCTLNKEKLEKLDRDNPLRVQCIDICEFIKQFDDADYIVLKLDVEGGEYSILSHLAHNNMLKRINLLYVEWHNQFFPQKRNVFINLMNYIKSNNINYRPWYY